MQRRCIQRIQSLYRLYLIVYKEEERYENDLFLREAKKKKKKKAVRLNQNRNYRKGCHFLHKKRREKRKEKKKKIFEEKGSKYIKGIERWALALHRSYLCCCPSV